MERTLSEHALFKVIVQEGKKRQTQSETGSAQGRAVQLQKAERATANLLAVLISIL